MKRRIALVTGATGGIGSKIATLLFNNDYFVIVHGWDDDRVKMFCDAIDPHGNKVCPIIGELHREEERCELLTKILDKFEYVDVLINNADFGGAHETWWQTTEKKWKDRYDLNVISMVALIKGFALEMINNGWGRIINIASVSGVQPLSIGPEYAASKAAIINLTISITKELSGKGITANSISPGLVLADGVRKYLLDESGMSESATDADIDKYASLKFFPTLVKQLIRPEDVANTVEYLLSETGSRITGKTS